jgi:HK97 family phage major capsid protein
MLKSDEIKLAQSKRRERMAEIQKADEISDEGRTELRGLADAYQNAEIELRASLVLESAERDKIKEPDNADKDFAAECRAFDLATLVESLEGQRVIEGREAEVIQELETRNGKASRGTYLPWEALQTRADVTVTAPDASAGKLASRPTMNALERLFEASAAQSFGVQTIQVTGKPRFPEMTQGASAAWVAEGGGTDAAAITTTVAEPALRTLTARYLLTRQAIRENSALEPMLRRDLSEVIREALDLAVFQGTGADEQPTGLENLASIAEHDHEGAAITYGDLVDWITDVMVSAKMNGMGGLHVAGVPFMLASLLKNSFGDGFTQLDMVRKVTSKLTFSSQVSDTANDLATAYIGATAGHAYVPMWGGPELIVDPYSESKTGKVALTVFTFPDVLVQRQASHFLKVSNIGKA